MCYAKPGPRCYGHAVEKYDAVKSKTAKTFRARENALTEMNNLRNADPAGHEKSPEFKKAQKNFTRLNDEYQDLSDKLEAAHLEVDATKLGMKKLQDRIDDRQPEKSVDEQMLKVHLEKRLEQANTLYTSRMLAYDQDHGTVDGRQPSRHGTAEGVAELKAKFDAVSKKREDAFDNAESDKFMRYNVQLKELEGKLSHAEMTKRYADNNIIKPESVEKVKGEKEITSLERKYETLSKDYQAKMHEYRQGPMKAVVDFKEARKDTDVTAWSIEDKKKFRSLKEEANDFKKKELEPLDAKIRSNVTALAEKSRETYKDEVTTLSDKSRETYKDEVK